MRHPPVTFCCPLSNASSTTTDTALTLVRNHVGLTHLDVPLSKSLVASLVVPASQDALLNLYCEHEQAFNNLSPYYGIVWPSALALSRHVGCDNIAAGAKVLELGSGVGLGGIAAALYGAPSSVLLTDIDPVAVELSRLSAERSGVSDVCSSAVADWHDLESWPESAFDVALGADVIYEEEACEAIAAVLAHSLRPGGTFLLADGKARRNRGRLWQGLLRDGAFVQEGEEHWVNVPSDGGTPEAQQTESTKRGQQPVVLARFRAVGG